MRTAVVAAGVCLASWLGLFIGAGNIGLQRSVAVSPLTLLEAPVALVLAFGASGAVAWIGSAPASRLVAWVLVGDLLGAGVLAPIAIGELGPMHAPIVFVAISALGLQPLGALLGAYSSGYGSRNTQHMDMRDGRLHR